MLQILMKIRKIGVLKSTFVMGKQVVTFIYALLRPYKYDTNKYPDAFLHQLNFEPDLTKPIDRVIYVFWTGDNAITPNRLNGIESLEKKSGIAVKLITPENLPEYIKPEDPLPEAYQYLSLVHRADYLRAYFMHYYGGGYADIKNYSKSWVKSFDSLEQSSSWILSYRERGWWWAAIGDDDSECLKKDLVWHWPNLIGVSAFICRPQTPFTAQWLAEAKKRLIDNEEKLKLHPATDVFGKNEDYPLAWAFLLGAIFHPLCFKFQDKIVVDNAIKPSIYNYR